MITCPVCGCDEPCPSCAKLRAEVAALKERMVALKHRYTKDNETIARYRAALVSAKAAVCYGHSEEVPGLVERALEGK